MISMSDDTRAILRTQGFKPSYSVDLTFPVASVDTTFPLRQAIKGLPALRSALKPRQRAPELTNISILLDNRLTDIDGDEARFFALDGRAGSIFKDATRFDGIALWHGATVKVRVGTGNEMPTVMTGTLADVQLDSEERTAELVVVDPLAELKKNTVKESLVGGAFEDVPPAHLVQYLLEEAGKTALLDSASFTDAVFSENTEGLTLESYDIPSGTWWNALNPLLGSANASLRWNAGGQLEYFKFRPTRPSESSDYVFKSGENMKRLRARQPEGAVINSASVTRSDGAGGQVATANSPIKDTTSIDRHGERQKEFILGFEDDFPAEQIAAEEMFYQAEFPTIFTWEGLHDSFLLELGDVAELHDWQGVGVQSQLATVFQKSIIPERGVTQFLAMDTFLTSQPWLWTENSHTLNGTKKVW